MRNLLLAGVAFAAVSYSAGAGAAPMLSYVIMDGGTTIGTGSSTTGSITLSGSDTNFSIFGNGTAAPLLATPNFSTTNFATTTTGGAGVITIKITNTGLTNFTSGNITDTFTLNSLTGPSFTTGTISNYFDSANTAYGTGTLLGTVTFAGQSSFSSGNSVSTTPGSLFSETTIYTLTFGSGTAGSITASSQLVATPEPASMAILGAGLAGIGLIRRKRA